MRTPLFLLLILFNGCATTQKIQQGQEVGCDYFSIVWNTATWDLARSKEKRFVKLVPVNWSDGSNEGQGFSLRIYESVVYEGHNVQEDIASINISSDSYQKRPEYISRNGAEIFFDKDADYETLPSNTDGSPKLMLDQYYKHIIYSRKWERITYLDGLKCIGDMYIGIGSKSYEMYCGYYDKTTGKRILRITISYDSPVFSQKRLNQNMIVKTGDAPSVQPVENLLKQAAEQLIGTIKIKNMDRERMEREGLMHHGKTYEISPY